jgi:alpha-mannosidase
MVTVEVRLSAELDAVGISFTSDALEPPNPDLRSALHTFVPFPQDGITLIHDHPFGISTVAAEGTYTQKYPTGEWMTSPQRYETVENPFTSRRSPS